MKTVYLSLGSNLGDRKKNMDTALELLEGPRLHLRSMSSLYETEPVDRKGQPWFLNMAVEAETDLFPMMLLASIARIEQTMGRKRHVHKGPRTIDIDILLFGQFVIETEKLVIPHPSMTQRRFVLEPMVELAPELRHPVLKRSIRELLAELKGQTVKRLSM